MDPFGIAHVNKILAIKIKFNVYNTDSFFILVLFINYLRCNAQLFYIFDWILKQFFATDFFQYAQQFSISVRVYLAVIFFLKSFCNCRN